MVICLNLRARDIELGSKSDPMTHTPRPILQTSENVDCIVAHS